MNALIVDDDENIVEMIAPLFAENGFNVFKAFDSESALQLAGDNEIHVMVVDVVIPHQRDRHVLSIVGQSKEPKVIIAMTGFENIGADHVYKDNVHAFFRKPFRPEDLFHTSQRFLKTIDFSARSSLTKREIEILGHILNGLTSKEIAKECFLSQRTVEKHRENIMKTLKVRNTAELCRVGNKFLNT